MPRRYRTPYDEDDLDITSGARFGAPSHAGVVSAISATISFGLLGMIGICWIIISTGLGPDEGALLLVAILLLDVGAFAASIVGVVQGFQSQGREQLQHRGYGLAGLIVSIICLFATLAVGLVSMCFGLFFAAVQNVPGG